MAKINNEEIAEIIGTTELKDYKTLIKQLLAEFIGTFLYLSIVLFAGIGIHIAANSLTTAFANGLLVASVIQIIGGVSGGHINPAVTLGCVISGHIKILKALFYILAQVLGSILGSLTAYALSDATRGDLGATVSYDGLTASQVLGIEALMTFVLVAVVLSVIDKSRKDVSSPLAIGLSVTACLSSAGTYSGSMNPVRSLGPAVVMNIWTHHWAYWAGPILGGILAGIFHKYLFKIIHVGNNMSTE